MLRLRLINPYSLTALIFCCALGSVALATDRQMLKVDIKANNYPVLAGWTNWVLLSNRATQEKTFDNGIRCAFTCPTGGDVGSHGNPNAAPFCSDNVWAVDPSAGQGNLDLVISFLSPGSYTFTSYHNTQHYSPCRMSVRLQIGSDPNTLVLPNVAQVADQIQDAAVFADPKIVNFTVAQPGQNVKLSYKTIDDVNQRDIFMSGFELTASAIYAAYDPYPLPESTIRYNTSYSFSWTAPDPYEAGAQYYDLYFTTEPNDLRDPSTQNPLFPTGAQRLVLHAPQSGIMSYPMTPPALVAYKDYYWRVDSYGKLGADPNYKTVGVLWHFDTDNQAPTLTLGLNQVSFPGRTITLNATATDLDGLGKPTPSVITYKWTYHYTVGSGGDPNLDPNYDDVKKLIYPQTTQSWSFVLDPNTSHVGAGRTYSFRCVAGDGANETTKDMSVFVANETRCQLAKRLGNYYRDVTFEGVLYPTIKPVGDLNDDCITDIKDLSLYVSQWLGCQAVNNLCP